MTTEKKSLPINFREELEKQSQAIKQKIAAPSGDRIRMNSGRYVLPNGQEGEEFDAVVIDFVSSNMFYEGSYDRNNPAPPVCFAVGPEPSLLMPVDASPEKQSDTCAACPNNQFGSHGRGKACKNTRLLAVVPVTASGIEEDAPLWIMSVPPTSIKAFDAYVSRLAVKQRTTPIGLVTRFSMDPSVDYAAPRFEAVRPLDDEELGTVFPMREEAMPRLSAVPDFTAASAPAAARAPVGRSGLGGTSRRGR